MSNIYTNYAGEIVEFNGTEEERFDLGLNLNCINCTYCTNCANCINCINCTNCTNCTYCTDCIDCINCRYCINCIDCRYCRYCINCVDCTKQPIYIYHSNWSICIRLENNTMKIGCQDHTIEKWFNFNDDEIATMHKTALEWWKIWKPILQLTIEQHKSCQKTS